MQEFLGPLGTSQSSRAAAQDFCSLGGHPGVQGDSVGDARLRLCPPCCWQCPARFLHFILGTSLPTQSCCSDRAATES